MDDLLQEMINPAPAQPDRPRRRRMWTTVAIVGLAAIGVTSLTTSALFSDREKSSATITTGALDLKADTKLDFNVPVDNMLPGAQIYAPVTITNTGSLAFEYAATLTAASKPSGNPNPDLGNGDSPATGNLPDMLHLDLYKIGTGADCTPTTAAAGTLVGRSPGAWGIGTNQQMFGAPTANAAGNRTVIAGASETLCAKVSFNQAADNTYQNTAAAVTLTFDAVQQLPVAYNTDPSGKS